MNSIPFRNYNRLLFYLSILLATFPLWPIKIQSALIITFCAPAVLGLFQLNKELIAKRWKWVVLFSFISLLTGLFYFFSEDKSSALHHAEKKIALIVIPVAFLLWPVALNFRQLTFIKWTFISACFLIGLKLVFLMLYSGFFIEALSNLNFYFIFRTAAENVTGIHPTYFSLYLAFSICIMLFDLLFKRYSRKKLAYTIIIVSIVFFSIILWLLATRMILIAFLISILIIFYWKFNTSKMYIIAVLSILALAILGYFASPSLKQRANQVFNDGIKIDENTDINDTNMRVAIYQCSWHLLQRNFVTGYSPGDVHVALNECYSEKFSSQKFKEKNYNSHNEFLNQWIGLGILGFLAFISMLFFPLKLALKTNEKLYVIFILLFTMACLTENILSRQHGLVFYAFFNSLLFFNSVLNPED